MATRLAIRPDAAPRPLGAVVAGAVIAAALFAGAALGQVKPADPVAKPPDGKAGRRLVFVLQTDATFTKNDLLTLLKKAKGDQLTELKKPERAVVSPTAVLNWDDVNEGDIIKLNQQTFQLFEQLSKKGGLRDIVQEADAGSLMPKLEAISGVAKYDIDMISANRPLVGLTLIDGKGQKMGEELKPAPGSPLEESKRGARYYTFTMKPDDPIPVKYRLRYTEAGNEKTEEREWPVSSAGHWLVELTNFDGETADLYKVLNKGKFSTPVKQIIPADQVTLALANLQADDTAQVTGFSGNRFLFRFNLYYDPNDKKELQANAMFILFPLTKEEATKVAKEVIDIGDEEKIMEYVQKGSGYAVSPPTDKDPLSSEGDKVARWFEVPAELGKYERGIDVDPKTMPGWLDKDRSYRVVVYRLNQAKPAATKFVPPKGGGQVWATAEQEEAWFSRFKPKATPPK